MPCADSCAGLPPSAATASPSGVGSVMLLPPGVGAGSTFRSLGHLQGLGRHDAEFVRPVLPGTVFIRCGSVLQAGKPSMVIVSAITRITVPHVLVASF
jgi:hypothetical protein